MGRTSGGFTFGNATYQRLTVTTYVVLSTATDGISTVTFGGGLPAQVVAGMKASIWVPPGALSTNYVGTVQSVAGNVVTFAGDMNVAGLVAGDMYTFWQPVPNQVLAAGIWRMRTGGGGGGGGGSAAGAVAATVSGGGGAAGGVAEFNFRSDGVTPTVFNIGVGGPGTANKDGSPGQNTSVTGGGFANPSGSDAANGGGPGTKATAAAASGYGGSCAIGTSYTDTTSNQAVQLPGYGGTWQQDASLPFGGWAAVCQTGGPGGAGAGGKIAGANGGFGAVAGSLFGGGAPGGFGGTGTPNVGATGGQGQDAADGSASGGGGAGGSAAGGAVVRGGHGGSGFVELWRISS